MEIFRKTQIDDHNINISKTRLLKQTAWKKDLIQKLLF